MIAPCDTGGTVVCDRAVSFLLLAAVNTTNWIEFYSGNDHFAHDGSNYGRKISKDSQRKSTQLFVFKLISELCANGYWRPEHLSASSSWTGTGSSQWQEMYLAVKQAQEQCALKQAFHSGRVRERCEEDLCVLRDDESWTTISGGGEGPVHSGLAKPRCPRKQHLPPNDIQQQQQSSLWCTVQQVWSFLQICMSGHHNFKSPVVCVSDNRQR